MEIRDKILEPYHISCDEFSYIVKKDTGKFSTDKKTGDTKPMYENKGYYSNRFEALKRIADLQINSKEAVLDVKSYFEEYNNNIRELIRVIGG